MSVETITSADDQGLGHAWLAIPHVVSDNARVVLRRLGTSSKTFLGPDGWQDGRHGLTPNKVLQEERSSRLLLGPQICNHVDPDIDVVIEVKDEAIPNGVWESTPTFWPTIKRSGRIGTAGGVLGDTPKTETPHPVKSVRPPEPPQKTTDIKGDPKAEKPVGTPPPAKEAGETTAPAKRRRWWLWAFVVIVLAAFLAAAGYLTYERWPDPWCGDFRLFCRTASGATPGAGETPAPSDFDALLAGGSDAWKRAIDDAATAPDLLMRLGLELRKRGDDTQAMNLGFLAIQAAEFRHHQPEALNWLAHFFDPRPPTGEPIAGATPNAASALDFLGKAARARIPGAAEDRRALCDWLNSGDRLANDEYAQVHESACMEP